MSPGFSSTAQIEPLTDSPTRFASQFVTSTSLDLLNFDTRPTFVLDLKADYENLETVDGVPFCNKALQNSPGLHEVVSRTFSGSRSAAQHGDESTFAAWTKSRSTSDASPRSKVFFDTLWTVTPTPDGWAVCSGVELSQCDFSSFNSADESERSSQHPDVAMRDLSSRNSPSSMDTDSRMSKASRRSRAPLGDIWPPTGLATSAHIAWIKEFDWASTSLGPIDTWSPQLRQACEMMLANPDPTTIFWGPDLILIYNEAYIALAGDKHPNMLGGSARLHWGEVWDQFDPLFEQMRADGKAFKQENTQLIINRRGFMEEGFFNMIVMPCLGDDGSVVGFYEPVTEVTKQTLSERRMHTLLQLSENTSSATTLQDLWQLLLKAMTGHEGDIHFAVLYSLHQERSAELGPQYIKEGSVGLGKDTSSFRPLVDIYGADRLECSALRSAHELGTPIVLNVSDQSLTPSMLQQLERAGMTESPRIVVVYPLTCSLDESIEAFITIGISPKRPYDDDYRLFINLLARQVESTITFVKLFEKEKERLLQQAVFDSEMKFKQFAESAPVGIFHLDPAGCIKYHNEAWLQLTGHDIHDTSPMSWANDIHPENVADIQGYWDKLCNLEGPQTFEVQYKKPWKPMNHGDESISLDRSFVVASAYAEVNESGVLTGIMGCITDISSWKWVDMIQSQRLSEALELKRQQDNFLDITSHEMRNPLNAILHCAAELIDLLTQLSAVPSDERMTVLDDCLEASRTIVYCGKHQKRIIDDVLTLSKLDSNLLSISPVVTRPLDVVGEVLKVFDTELRTSNIQTRTELAESYTKSRIDSVVVDPHRVIQILINLVANAIKFVKGESLRSLHIVIGAFTLEPSSSDTGVRYVPSGRHRTDPTEQTEWGDGEPIFLHFSVQDTGPGMSRQEADLLFNRFAQGSPRTHVQYGGSGLGLFISRELAELHGGRIGISSELGLGSTFDFYIKARRSTSQHTRRRSTDRPSKSAAFFAHKVTQAGRTSDTPPPPISSTKSSPSVLQKPSTLPSLHVLIVEDNLINQKILTKLMRKRGYAVSIANHGEEALNVIQASSWYLPPSSSPSTRPLNLDIVLCDIEMPVMDGKVFAKQVREWQAKGKLTNTIPIIAVTGNARSEQIEQAKECGFDDVVSKPYQVQDLVTRIEKYTGSRR